MLKLIRGFFPACAPVKWPERVRAAVGTLLGVAVTGGFTHLAFGKAAAVPLLIAPMGASAVLLFGIPSSPLAQPWSFLVGNVVSASIGVTCAALVHNPIDSAALAIGLSIVAMFTLRCVHPPSGAVALTAVLGGPSLHALGYGFVLAPVVAQSVVLLACAIIYHAITAHRYPHERAVGVAQVVPDARAFLRKDLGVVLARRREMLDVDPDDLESLLSQTQLHAYARCFAELTCEHIMSKTVVTVTTSMSVQAAMRLLSRHHVKALPVIDDANKLCGIVTRADLTVSRGIFHSTFVRSLKRLFVESQTPPLVACAMSADVCTVEAEIPIGELVPMFARLGHHHIPVVDGEGHLVGMITEADLISGLYHQSLERQRLTG
nr:HPP family protein [Burkholderia sp. THE68]